MAAADKDLETLRKEHKDLSDYATRVVFVAITTLLLLTISISRAWDRVQKKDVSDKIAEIGATHSKFGQCQPYDEPFDECEIDVSFVFGLQLEKSYDTDTYSTNPAGPNSHPAATPTPCRDLPPEQRQKLKTDFCTEQRKLEPPLEDVAKQAFVVKAPIPGIDVNVDLRSWLLGLPMVFCVFGIYLYILSKKLSLLEIAAIDRLRNSRGEATQLDRLYFEGDRAFSGFPARLSAFMVRLAFIVLPVYLIYIVFSVAWRYREYGGTELILALVSLVGVCLFYAVVYAQFAGYKLERQMASVIDIKEIGAKSLFGRGKKIVDVLAKAIDPRVTIALGCLLVLMTLLMPFTKEGFWARRNYMGYKEYLGYELLLPSGAHWPTLPGKLGEVFSTYDRLSRGTYLLTLLVVLSAALLFIPRLSPQRKWIVRLATTGAIISFLFAVVDFSITLIDRLGDIGWTFREMFAVKIIALVATIVIAIWSRYLISQGGTRQERGRDIRVLVLTVHAPLFLMAVVLARWIDLEGPVAYLAGMLLLFVGLAHLRKSVGAQAR